MINWVLQKNLTKPEILDAIKTALNKPDELWEEVKIVPFAESFPPIKNQKAYLIIYGSTTFMLNAFSDKRLNKGVFYNPETFQMKNYVERWNHHVLNASGRLLKFGNVPNILSPPSKKWFVRPNMDSKIFSGKVDTFKNLSSWSDQVCKLNLPNFNEATEIWISETQKIEKEWRLFIVDDQIVSSSRYMNNGQLEVDKKDNPLEMLTFARNRISEYRLNDVYVMDIAQIDNSFKIIECNCFNGTGFYKHDIAGIVTAINDFIRTKKN